MFCTNCGQQNDDNAKFCFSCGQTLKKADAPVESQSSVIYQKQKSNIRTSEMDALNQIYSYFASKKKQYDEYDAVCASIIEYAKGPTKKAYIWGRILTSIAGPIVIIIAAIFSMIAIEAEEATFLAVAIPFMLPFMIPLIIGVSLLIHNAVIKRKHKNGYQDVKIRYAKLSSDLFNHYIRFSDCPIGAEYTNPEILKYMMDMIRAGQADTIKESLTLVIEKANRNEFKKQCEIIEKETVIINQRTRARMVFMPSKYIV